MISPFSIADILTPITQLTIVPLFFAFVHSKPKVTVISYVRKDLPLTFYSKVIIQNQIIEVLNIYLLLGCLHNFFFSSLKTPQSSTSIRLH